MATNYDAILKYMRFAKGVYGTGPGTAPLSVGWNQPVVVTDFRATSPNFQGALYKDSQTGKYHIAIAGTDDLKGDALADLVLAGQDAHIVGWHPEMSDALKFAYEAIKQIAGDLRTEDKKITLDAIRERVDVSGHSLGGALAEMVGKFFGLSGYNIDGPGVARLLTRPEYAAFQDQVRQDFPELQSDYKLEPGQFGATAFSIVGAAGTHLSGVDFSAQPGVMSAYYATVVPLLAGMAGIGVPVALLTAIVSALDHPSGAITRVVEQALGYPSVPSGPSDFGIMNDAPALAYYRANPNSAAALGGALEWYAQAQGLNVLQGLSPNGIPLDGSPVKSGQFQIVAQRDDETGRIREIYTPVSPEGAAIGSPFVKEFLVNAQGDVGSIDGSGNVSFIQGDLSGRVGVLTVHPDGRADFQGITSPQRGSGTLDAETTRQIFDGKEAPGFGVPSINLTGATIDALQGTLEDGILLASGNGIQTDAGISYGQPPDVAAQQAAIRSLLSSYGDNIQFARSGHTYTLYNADGELIGSARVDGAELHFTMLDGSEHRVNAWGVVDDGPVSVPSDPEGGGNSAESGPITGDEPPPTTVFGAVQSVQSLLQAIEAGDTRAIVTASASLLANIDRLTGGVLPEGVAPGLNALAASLNLLTAIQDGNGLAIAASSLNLSSQAASLYAGMLRDQGIAAFQAGDASAKSMLEGAGTVGQVAGALALAASVVSLVMAIEGGNGYQIASASLGVVSGGLAMAGGAYTPWAFPVAAVAMAVTLVGSYISDKDIPTLEGEATAVWNPDGSIHVLSTLDLEQGGATPARLLQSLVDGLQQSLASQVDANGDPLYAIIPQRLPTIGYAYDPDSPHGNFAVFFGGAPGHLYLKWIDENGQEQTRYFDGSGSRNQEGQATLAQEFMSHALRAVVPAWEAESVLAHMRDAGALSAPMTGSIDENRARVAQQLRNQDWQQPDAHAGMPTEDADGITQRFTALTVELKPELPAGVSTGRVGRNVDLDVYIEQTDWVQANQGILAIDLNGDGVIGQNEILTTDTQAAADHARNSLQWLDINHDSKLDASDPAFKALGIWLDANRNGQTDDGEFASFLDRGVASLDFTGAPPVLRAADGSIFHVTEQHLSADVRGDHYLAGFADTDGDGQIDAFAGVLHAHEGGETVLNAVVTHDYTGEAGHTHGGGVAGEGEMRVDVSDDAIHTTSDRQHTQILAEDVIAAGDIRVTSGPRILPVGETTNTQVAAGDARLTSNGSAASSRPARRTESLAANDRRVKSEPPANASDAFAAIRNAWIKSSDSLFGATGALMGVAVGTVAGAAAAAPFTQDPDAVQTLAGSDPTASNTVSAVPSDVNFEPTTSTAPSAPRFVASPVASLAPAQPSGTNSLADGLTVDVAPSQIVSVPGSGITVSDVPVSALTGATLAPPPLPDVRLAVPDVVDDQVAGFEDTRYGFDAALLLANDTTRNTSSQPLKLTQVFGAEHGTVSMTVQPDGSQRIVFVPDQDYWGPARFRYTVEDAYGLASQGRVALDIAPVNDAPVTAGEYVESDEDAGILLTPAQLLANDFDVDTATMGDVLSVVRVSDAQHGLAVMDAAGNVRFLPDHDYFGPAGFTYWVSDGNGALTPTAVRIEILPVNDAPVVAGETVSTDEDTVLLIQQAALLTNDSDVDNPHGDLTIFAVRPGQHGAVELLPDGQIRFVPEQDYFGKATFLYTVSDGSGGYTEAVATVDLAPVNDAPIVTGEQFAGAEDEAITFASKSLLANDQDVDDAQSSLTLVAVGNAAHGEVRLNADGSIQFIPDADYFGAASFEYTVSDPLGATTTGRVDIDLAPVNDAPRLQPDVLAGAEDTALTIESAALLANDVDVDNDHTALTVTRASSASHGAVSLNPDGSIRFVPDQDFYGDASFTYEVRDGAGGLSTATTTVHVAPVNDAPIANDNLVDSRKGVAVTITAAALLGDDYDIDNAHTDLRIVGVADAENGTVRLNADGSVTFLPDPGHGGYPGAHGQFTYTISDGAGGFATATTVVNLEKINTAPVVVDDGFSGYENTPFVINAAQFLANDSDPDGDAISFAQVANAQHGTVEIQSDGQVRFTPDHGFYGQASFQYSVTDPFGGQTWGTAYLQVAHVNQAPIIEAIEYGMPIFGYYNGPPRQVGHIFSLGDRTGGIAYTTDYNGSPVQSELQPVYDPDLAAQLINVGRLFNANGLTPVSPQHYLNGSLKPIAFDHNDAIVHAQDGDGDVSSFNITYSFGDSPTRQSGRAVVYDPDGDSSAATISIVGGGPQHGHAYANKHGEKLWGMPMDSGDGTYQVGAIGPYHPEMVAARYFWYYRSEVGDPYNGADNFTIRITDSEGATTDVVVNATHKGTNASGGFTPIVLDLNGNGIELLAADHSQVKADVNHDGRTEQIGWAAATDGVLGFDADGDGRISVEETRLTNFVPGAKTDLEALAHFDTNHDGKISQEDAAWSRLRVVQDANRNGEFTAAEHKTLDEAGIASIGLQRRGEAHLVHGNMVFGTMEVTHTDGSKSEAADVMFAGKDVPLPSFAVFAEEQLTGVMPEMRDDHAFSAEEVAQLTASHGLHDASQAGFYAAMPAFPSPTDNEIVQRMVLQFVQAMNTQTAPAEPLAFVPPHEETFADVTARLVQASVVDSGMGYQHTS